MRSNGYQEGVSLAVPSSTDGDATGDAIEDVRYATLPTKVTDQLPEERSDLGVSVTREALLIGVIQHGLERPKTSRRRASDHVL